MSDLRDLHPRRVRLVVAIIGLNILEILRFVKEEILIVLGTNIRKCT